MNDTSFIEISKGALLKNLAFIKRICGEGTEFVSVVKGNAYGHGISQFVPLAFDCGVRSFAVFSTIEAENIVKSKVNFDRLIVMGPVDYQDVSWLIGKEIEFFVFDFELLNQAVEIAKKKRKKANIHIELETGLNRTGFGRGELRKVVSYLKENERFLEIKGVCSHLGGAESISNYLRIKKQIGKFNNHLKLFGEGELKFGKRHLACSAATINYPKTVMDMVRIGIMQYGFWPSKEVRMAYLAKRKGKNDPLVRVISWKSKVMHIKSVKPGEFIGYGNSVFAETKMTLAIVPVGYAYGFSRALSNQGRVLIAGARANVLGMVNMNMVMVDISNIQNIKKGDEVVLIGDQGSQSISVSSFGDLSVQLNYELLTRLPCSLPRIITE